MKRHAIHLFALVAGLACAAPASSADFTFDVPVTVENLPSLTSIGVQCAVYSGATVGGIIAVARSAPVAVSGGRYDGTITVEVNNEGLTPSSEARSYRCGVVGGGTSRTGVAYGLSIDSFIDGYQRATGHMIVTANNNVSGPIP
ncbi:MAG: hypothetical protein ABIN68_05880 [Sphingomicrobium sp.]